jgi:hypothetical protein
MIKQSVLNTFDRVGIDYIPLLRGNSKSVTATNRFSGETCQVTPLIARLITWVYETSNAYERGETKVNLSDFDRVRYFILDSDNQAYMTCID